MAIHHCHRIPPAAPLYRDVTTIADAAMVLLMTLLYHNCGSFVGERAIDNSRFQVFSFTKRNQTIDFLQIRDFKLLFTNKAPNSNTHRLCIGSLRPPRIEAAARILPTPEEVCEA